MTTTRDLSERCRSHLASELRSDEKPIAQGRADHVRSLSSVPVGNGYTFLLVTSRRVLWTSFLAPDRVHSLRFGDISSTSEGQYQHRYVLFLRHRPVERVEWVPRWRFLWWSWGNAEAPLHRTETIFEFSRGDSQTARTIRDQLAGLGIPAAAPLELPSPPPREPPRYLAARREILPRRGATPQ